MKIIGAIEITKQTRDPLVKRSYKLMELKIDRKQFKEFMYWITERHSIYKLKESGKPKPWTNDKILQENFFTNPYRENDKVTKWFRKNIREPLKNDSRVLFATIAFRWFNLPSTGELLIKEYGNKNIPYGYFECWIESEVIDILSEVRNRGESIFTGAFMISSPPGKPKLESICQRISNVWWDRDNLFKFFRNQKRLTMEKTHKKLMEYPGLGGFMAYEIVCDLRYTYLLKDAPDKMTWCNPGPGAIRGLARLTNIEFDASKNTTIAVRFSKIDWKLLTEELLVEVNDKLKADKMPMFEMREIEHSLCEFDKYQRLKLGQGRGKRKYNGAK